MFWLENSKRGVSFGLARPCFGWKKRGVSFSASAQQEGNEPENLGHQMSADLRFFLQIDVGWTGDVLGGWMGWMDLPAGSGFAMDLPGYRWIFGFEDGLRLLPVHVARVLRTAGVAWPR